MRSANGMNKSFIIKRMELKFAVRIIDWIRCDETAIQFRFYFIEICAHWILRAKIEQFLFKLQTPLFSKEFLLLWLLGQEPSPILYYVSVSLGNGVNFSIFQLRFCCLCEIWKKKIFQCQSGNWKQRRKGNKNRPCMRQAFQPLYRGYTRRS